MAAKDVKYTVLADTETGDLTTSGSLLTVYCAVLDDKLQIVEDLDLKLKPDNGALPVATAGALKVNKIDIQKHMADVETLPYSEGKVRLTAMMEKYHNGKSGKLSNLKILAHNTPFDVKFLQTYLIPEMEWNFYFHHEVLDTLADIRFLKRHHWIPSDLGKLGTIVDYFNLPKREAHAAKGDALMCLDVYRKLSELMASKKDGGQKQDLISLLEQE